MDQFALQSPRQPYFLTKGDDQPQERADDDRVREAVASRAIGGMAAVAPGGYSLVISASVPSLKTWVQQRLQAVNRTMRQPIISSQMRICTKGLPAPAEGLQPPRQRNTSSSTNPTTLKISSEPLSVICQRRLE